MCRSTSVPTSPVRKPCSATSRVRITSPYMSTGMSYLGYMVMNRGTEWGSVFGAGEPVAEHCALFRTDACCSAPGLLPACRLKPATTLALFDSQRHPWFHPRRPPRGVEPRDQTRREDDDDPGRKRGHVERIHHHEGGRQRRR